MILERLFSLSGRVALVTGAARGIGLTIARALGEAGADVVLNDTNENRLETACEELTSQGLRAIPCPFDVCDSAAVHAAVTALVKRTESLDVVVNNAAIQDRRLVTDYPAEAWRTVIDTDLNGCFNVAQAAGAVMHRQGSGRIINIASILAQFGHPKLGAYASAKAGLLGLTRVLAAELGPAGVTANALAPGYIRTELNETLFTEPTFTDWLTQRTPAGRFGRPEDLIGGVLYFASDAGAFVNGQVLAIDGGMTATL